MTRCTRWSDNDSNFGPFTYSRDRIDYRPLAVVIDSGDGDDYAGCSLRISGFGHTLIARLPPVVRPYRRKVKARYWSADEVQRQGRDWYWDTHSREYGFSCVEGYLHVYLGPQTHDSETTRSWTKALPWTEWRIVRHSLYDLEGRLFWDNPSHAAGKRYDFDALHEAQKQCPSRTFVFRDFDGEELTASTFIEEREWHRGEGRFKWLSHFVKSMIRRSLDITFSSETGNRKGSWKGGTVGHSIDMLPGELHEPAFRRYCAEQGMTFVSQDQAYD